MWATSAVGSVFFADAVSASYVADPSRAPNVMGARSLRLALMITLTLTLSHCVTP